VPNQNVLGAKRIELIREIAPKIFSSCAANESHQPNVKAEQGGEFFLQNSLLAGNPGRAWYKRHDYTSHLVVVPGAMTHKFGISKPVRRSEDGRLITGTGSFTDDVNVTGQAHAIFLRSSHGHGLIRSIDAGEALNTPGVLGVIT
jgi:hypothetical protein